MSIKRLFYTETSDRLESAGLLVFRLVVGTAFVFHGLPKVQNPFNWANEIAAVGGGFQLLAALAEFVGGICLILGFLTRLASIHIGGVMVVALVIFHLPQGHPFVVVGKPGQPSCELATVYLACALLLLLLGAGQFSLDALLFGDRGGTKSTA